MTGGKLLSLSSLIHLFNKRLLPVLLKVPKFHWLTNAFIESYGFFFHKNPQPCM